ncbi:hypothetical protein EJF36_11105 [Bacillus sp. HMF5848]|uniref:phage holin family protein n=1 Tax=Bacillus sp. HMF5848 TaxID=2495421 RepID=UPI000F79123D|nr:phage holin family protein [Bacillus sp. HMF5848]RSK27387.1 hypothetical protein EJF36_11105 [Bacillus sp. HMF5848]
MLAEILSQIKINQQLIIVVPALMVLGYILKKTPRIPDWLILWFLLLVGVVSSIITLGFSVNGVANGIIAAGMAITSHQAIKQTFSSVNRKKDSS